MAQTPTSTLNWRTIGRIALKTAVLLLLFNFLFAALRPQETLGRLSLYNHLWPGRTRLPYGEDPATAYNLSLNNIPALFASHTLNQPKAAHEYRLLLIGDSGLWGWLLPPGDTLAAQINAQNLTTADGRTIVAYNLGYPIMSLSKDLLLLDEAMRHDPDAILWLVTLESLAPDKQTIHPLLLNNPQRMAALSQNHQLQLDTTAAPFVNPTFGQSTILGQRRPLADLIRLQLLGLPWAATGIDQAIPTEYTPRQSDFEPDESWQSFPAPTTLTTDDLAFNLLQAGVERVGDTPLLIVNEPIYRSNGRNNHLRYNAWYPRWAYDQYRTLLATTAATQGWPYADLWDAVPPDQFTDSPVHLTAQGTAVLLQALLPHLED